MCDNFDLFDFRDFHGITHGVIEVKVTYRLYRVFYHAKSSLKT